MMPSIDSMRKWTPAAIIIIAMAIVVKRSIFSLFLEYLWWLAIFSLIITRNPEMESIKLCVASEVIAMEPDKIPTNILKIPSKKLVAMNR